MARDRRVLPHNVEAEASILGGIILRNEVLSHLDTIEVEDFYDNRHKVVFQAIRNLEAAAKPIDVVTLEVEIEKAGKLDAIGGVAFLGELTLRVPTVDNVVTYAEIVTDKHQARKLNARGRRDLRARLRGRARGPRLPRRRRGQDLRGHAAPRQGGARAAQEPGQEGLQLARRALQVGRRHHRRADRVRRPRQSGPPACSRPSSSSSRPAPRWARPRSRCRWRRTPR